MKNFNADLLLSSMVRSLRSKEFNLDQQAKAGAKHDFI